MIALWYRNGVLAPAPFHDGRQAFRMRRPTQLAPIESVLYSSRERRRAAREHGGRGRRGARPVPLAKPAPRLSDLAVEIDSYKQHRLSDGRSEVALYLPEGERVERRHLDDVERWLQRGATTDTRRHDARENA